ncbi:MAG: zinc ABC transporter solute-binding protein [Gammaproteobacteria bacterium]|nr:zinc ABC transporter solute-binding protein [Gammaproteobacteria bacterium]
MTNSRVLHSLLSGLMGSTASLHLLSGDLNEQRIQLAKADLIFRLDEEMGGNSAGSTEPGANRQLISVLDNESLKVLPSRGNENIPDPYFWMDSRNVLILISEMTSALINNDPARAHVYRRNFNSLNQRASKLDRALEYGYRDLQGASAVLYHDVLQYFEQAYALKTSSVLVSFGQHEVDISELVRAREQLLSGQVSCLLVEVSQPAAQQELLLQNTKARLGQLDVRGTSFATGPDLYFELMEYNTREIKRCLGRQVGDLQGEELPPASNIEVNSGRFMLSDQNGNFFSDQDMRGNYHLVNFGYTYCPDVCPTSLLVMSRVVSLLGSRAESVRYYFITIDPERDTAERINQYVAYFSPRLIGLTGSDAMIARVAKHFKVKYEKEADPLGDPQRYAMNHSAGLYLMAPDGKFVIKFAYGLSAEQIVEKMEGLPL